MSKLKTVVSWIVLAMLAMVLFSGIRGSNKPTQATQQAETTTKRNAFISGCTNEGAERSECVCMLDAMIELYPDFLTNMERMDRIISSGYNSTETDEAVKCVSPSGVKET